MPSLPRRPLAAAGLTLALTLTLTACGGDSAGPGPDPAPAPAPGPAPSRSPDPITEADAAFVGNVVLPNLYASLGGVTGPQVIPDGTPELPPDGCPSFDPAPPPDADADGIPDGATFSFDAESCDSENEERSFDWHGAVRVSDPGAGRGYDLEFLGFGVTLAEASGDFTADTRHTGPRSARGTASAVTVTERIDFRSAVNLASILRSRTDWTLEFTATAPGTITGDVLPAGTAELEGVFLVDADTREFELVVETPEPLVYDPSCTSFTAGTLRIFAAGREEEGEVRVSFNACGEEPSVVFGNVPG